MKLRVIAVSFSVSYFVSGASIAAADRESTATNLFEQGLQDLRAGRYEAACRELAESLAASPDSGTKGALAECQTATGKTASAWALWRDLATSAPAPDLRVDAAEQAAKLEPRLARITLRAHGTAPGLVVTIDGRLVNPTTAGVPVDPGAVVVRVTADDIPPWTRTIQATGGTTVEVDLPVTSGDPAAGARHRHVAGLVTAAAGIAIVGTAGVLGLISRSAWRRTIADCGGDPGRCPDNGVTRAQQDLVTARNYAELADVAAVVAGAAIVTGLVLLVTARHHEPAIQVVPIASAHAVGLTLSGRLP